MKDTESAQKGNRFKTRITKVRSPPIVTYAGKKVYLPDEISAQAGKEMFNFLLECQKDFEDRYILKTSFNIERKPVKQLFDNLPKKELARYFWYDD